MQSLFVLFLKLGLVLLKTWPLSLSREFYKTCLNFLIRRQDRHLNFKDFLVIFHHICMIYLWNNWILQTMTMQWTAIYLMLINVFGLRIFPWRTCLLCLCNEMFAIYMNNGKSHACLQEAYESKLLKRLLTYQGYSGTDIMRFQDLFPTEDSKLRLIWLFLEKKFLQT